MPVVFALALKDLKILVRLRSGLFFSLAWPLLVAILFGTIFAGDGGSTARLRIAVVDEDGSQEARDFAARLETGEEFETARTSRAEALSAVRRGTRTAAVIIPAGFGEAGARMFYGAPPSLELWIDPSRKAESGMLQGILMKYGAERMQAALTNRAASQEMLRKAREDLAAAAPGAQKDNIGRFLGDLDRFLQAGLADAADANGQWQPLAVEQKAVARTTGPYPKNSYDLTFPQGILWGIIGCVMTFGLGIVSERTHGTLVRLQMAPVSRAQILGGKALACFLAIAGVEVALFTIGRAFFGVRPTSWILLAAAGISAAVAFVGIMMLVSVLGKSEQAAAGAGWAVMLPLAMLGGGMIPLFVMPSWMVRAGNVSPAKWAVLAFEGAIWRGFSVTEIFLPCAILVATGIVCFAVGTRAFPRTS
jgi:ABC-2 type transport system permease protein